MNGSIIILIMNGSDKNFFFKKEKKLMIGFIGGILILKTEG